MKTNNIEVFEYLFLLKYLLSLADLGSGILTIGLLGFGICVQVSVYDCFVLVEIMFIILIG